MQYETLSKIYYKKPQIYDQLYLSRFNNEATKKLNFYINGNQAFIFYCYEIVQLISKIYRGDKRIRDILTHGQAVPGVALNQFVQSCLVEEIQITNEIEGVNSSHKDIVDVIEKTAPSKVQQRLQGIVQKYNLLRDKNHNISLQKCQDVRKLYDELVGEEVIASDPKDAPNGMIFRGDSVSVYSVTGKEIHRGVYPESAIITSMEEALRLLNNAEVEPLVAMSIFHYMFGYIHPFYNGNGRMARFISSYILAANLDELTAFGFAVVIKKRLKDYYDAFALTASPFNKGDVTPFVITMLEFVLEDIEKLATSLKDKKDELQFYAAKLKNKNLPEKQYKLLYVLVQNKLFGTLELGVNELCKILYMSSGSVRKLLASGSELIAAKNSEHNGRKLVYEVVLENL